jgi:ankyrin repeat protein
MMDRIDLIDLISLLPQIEKEDWDSYVYVIKDVLRNTSNLDIKDFRGWYPLHYVAYDNVDKEGTITNLLIKAGSNINVQDDDGDTPLHYTIFNNNLTVLKILLNEGADITIKNKKGQTPAGFALKFGGRQKIYHLLKGNLKH